MTLRSRPKKTSDHGTSGSGSPGLTGLHAHRQNHNSSKLPAFRFADRFHRGGSRGMPRETRVGGAPGSDHTLVPSPFPPAFHPSHTRNDAVSTILQNHVKQQVLSAATDPRLPPLPPSINRTCTVPAVATPRRSSSLPHAFSVSPAANIWLDAVESPSTAASPLAPEPPSQTAPASGASSYEESASALEPTRLIAAKGAGAALSATRGQQALPLPKTIDTTSSDEKRRSRPPVSFRAPFAAGAIGARVPPIRSFRSSGSRKSLVLDMNSDHFPMTPPDSAEARSDQDNTAEIFLQIAREDTTRHVLEDTGMRMSEDPRAKPQITRHRRPLSLAIPPTQAFSPPRIPRRLSDQRDTTRARSVVGAESIQRTTCELADRAISRDQPLPSTEVDSFGNSPLRTIRPSPINFRQIAFQDAGHDTGSAYSRRRASLTENNYGGLSSRTTQLRSFQYGTPGSSRSYNSSPLVPKSVDAQRHESRHGPDAAHGVEGTESSTSTAAPSTVWDELDELKSRIHRLELTGKLPGSSGMASSRVSDERPPTATTHATTVSASPNQGFGQNMSALESCSPTPSQREQQPILLSALNKARNMVSTEVFSAVEAAATEALSLSSMMGTPGQPGPISSGASVIGAGGSLTDRQLRKKADSICRSLTELCIALSDGMGKSKTSELVTSPTTLKHPFNLRRLVARVPGPDQGLLPDNTNPARAPTSLEQRRMSLLNSPALVGPRPTLGPTTPTGDASFGRKSSLIVSRSRRAVTEEPEETSAGSRSSLLLRTRRAGTEEREERVSEVRKGSLLLRSARRDTNLYDEDGSRSRAPSRASTVVHSLRSKPRGLAQVQATAPLEANDTSESTGLPRRRPPPASLTTRLVAPTTFYANPGASRRYLERLTPERESNSVAEKLAEDRGQRPIMLSQAAVMNRAEGVNRRSRESGFSSPPSATGQAGATSR